MRIVSYGFLGVGAAVSCFLAFWWLGTPRRRCIALSLIAGIICGISVCLNLDVQMCIAMCFLFLIIYIPIIMQPRTEIIDIIAMVSISCACFGMLQMTAGTLLRISMISLFFRVMLIIVYLVGVFFIYRKMEEGFPGAGWQECFAESEPSKNGKRRVMTKFGLLFAGYGFCLGMPAVMGVHSVAAMWLEWFAFFGGLRLINLIISSRKEKLTILTEKQYRDDMQTYMSVIRSQRHDYNFHVQTLHGLLLRKDYEACEAYLDELLKDSIAMNQLLPLQDAAISALILSFQSKAAQSGIRMEISIENDLSQVATNVYETNKVIGNLLQNAIDETEVLPDKSYGIKLSILKRGEFCIINVSNRTRHRNPMENYQIGHSAKVGHEGIGIASIQALAARYGGVVYSRMEDDIIYFVAKLPLRLIKEGA
ncbi:sensor histidine kinase [Bariatricus sp. SGI.154]|uniref:sensor histidine kinase n=1 Tax=Bariatricus sp. SGI.154 TaxID=3420549 RepID=UPI003D045AD5